MDMESLIKLQQQYFTFDDFFKAFPNNSERKVAWERMRKIGINPKWHTAIPVCCDNLRAMIDLKIAHLISRFWGCGIVTLNSCEGHTNGNVWLVFQSSSGRQRSIELMGIEQIPYQTSDYHHDVHGECFLLEFSIEYRDFALSNIGENPFAIVRYQSC